MDLVKWTGMFSLIKEFSNVGRLIFRACKKMINVFVPLARTTRLGEEIKNKLIIQLVAHRQTLLSTPVDFQNDALQRAC